MNTNRCKRCGKFISKSRKYCSQKCKKGKHLEGKYKNCKVCGNEFYTTPSWDYDCCSRKCAGISKRDRVTLECEICGLEFEVQKHAKDSRRTCSRKCRGDLQAKIYEKIESTKVECECKNCGDKVKRWPRSLNRNDNVYCSPECQREVLHNNISGSNHWNWKGGWDDYFGENWFSQRSKARERDDFKCQICGKGKEELGKMPSVHHIKPQRLFESKEKSNKVDNLITVCEKHHNFIEGWNLVPSNTV